MEHFSFAMCSAACMMRSVLSRNAPTVILMFARPIFISRMCCLLYPEPVEGLRSDDFFNFARKGQNFEWCFSAQFACHGGTGIGDPDFFKSGTNKVFPRFLWKNAMRCIRAYFFCSGFHEGVFAFDDGAAGLYQIVYNKDMLSGGAAFNN